MVLSRLGAAKEAFEVTQGYLLGRGELLVQQHQPQGAPPVTDQHQRMAMMLWIPATKALRLHPDFRSLCDGIGLVEYWRRASARPDFREASLAMI